MEKKKRKLINPDLIILVCIAIAALFFVICTSCRSTIAEGGPGKCIAISIFGKLELKNIDRVIITAYGEKQTVTNTDLISQIVSETKVASYVASECHADCCGCDYPHFQIDLYRGDKIIRTMEWQGCCNYVRVYEPDLTHWLFAPGCEAEAGYSVLSNELIVQLNALIERA